ncbi:hypothetical protein SDC9_186146 [bioreactor metagenome]|uniref:Uncharacterized protein n=1 Tax=bioreactor metagenome TaxID=1076179 RepID=A0A645HJQ2_9ZZZZ
MEIQRQRGLHSCVRSDGEVEILPCLVLHLGLIRPDEIQPARQLQARPGPGTGPVGGCRRGLCMGRLRGNQHQARQQARQGSR